MLFLKKLNSNKNKLKEKVAEWNKLPQVEALKKDMNVRAEVRAMNTAELCSVSPPPLTLLVI